jgi:hypothetical protein
VFRYGRTQGIAALLCTFSSFRTFPTIPKNPFSTYSRFFSPRLAVSTSTLSYLRSNTSAMPPKKEQQDNVVHSKEVNTDTGYQFQAGSSDDDDWKHKEPYSIRTKDKEFETKWRGSCHCGRVQYQLSREVPLDAKYCHCTTCQRLHGVYSSLSPACSRL